MTETETIKAVVRTVTVNRDRNPQQVLDALTATGCASYIDANPASNDTRRTSYIDWGVLLTMPSGGKGIQNNLGVEFFKLDRSISGNELPGEYRKHSLTPDPYAVAAVNEADPGLVSKHPNFTYWEDKEGRLYIILFDKNGDARCVSVSCLTSDLGDHLWIGGTPC